MIRLLCTFLLLMTTGLLHAGVGTSGGGNTLIDESMGVHLIDFVYPYQRTIPLASTSEVMKSIYAQDRYVKTLAHPTLTFFSCAIKQLVPYQHDYPALEVLLRVLPTVSVRMIEQRLKSSGFHVLGEADLRVETSRSIDRPQWPAAYYFNNYLLISKRLFARMSEVDQCGLAVHEAFRHLNFIGVLERPLSTSDIEMLTRYVMGRSFVDDHMRGDVATLLRVNAVVVSQLQHSYPILRADAYMDQKIDTAYEEMSVYDQWFINQLNGAMPFPLEGNLYFDVLTDSIVRR